MKKNLLGVTILSAFAILSIALNIALAVLILGSEDTDKSAYPIVGSFGWAVSIIYVIFAIINIKEYIDYKKWLRKNSHKLLLLLIVIITASCSSSRYTCEAYGSDIRKVRGDYKIERTDKPRAIWQ